MFKNMIDRETFKAIVGHYGADYQDGIVADRVVDRMINNHVSRKEHIFKLFGDKLKVEKEVDVTVGHEAINQIKRELVDSLCLNKKMIVAASFMRMVDCEEFSTNVLGKNLSIFNVALTKGMKVSRALLRLVLPEHQHEVSTLHSMAYQKIHTRGKVVLSIDPCDYATMSSNKSGWRSCHRLDGGEYRTGPLAYLNDSSTVICYIESSTDCEFTYQGKPYKHSNKVWRQIALVSPELDFAMQERQYPNSNETNQLSVSNIFKELFEELTGATYSVEKTDTDMLKKLHIDYTEAQDGYNSGMYYNDITNEMFSYGNVIRPTALSIRGLENCELPVKGSVAYCLECGEELEDSNSLYCCDCHSCCDDDEW